MRWTRRIIRQLVFDLSWFITALFPYQLSQKKTSASAIKYQSAEDRSMMDSFRYAFFFNQYKIGSKKNGNNTIKMERLLSVVI